MKFLFSAFCLVFFFFSTLANDNNSRPTSPQKTSQAARPNVPGDLIIDFGVSLLSNAPDQMDLRLLGSRAVNFYYLYHVKFGPTSNFSFNPGFGVGIENFNFSNDITLTNIPTQDGANQVNIVELNDLISPDADFRKSKLAVTYFDIPMELRFHLNRDNHDRGLKIAVGGRVGVRLDAHTKVKYDLNDNTRKLKQKESFQLNGLRYGVHGRMGFGALTLFYYQNLSQLFQDGEGPGGTDANSFMAGVSFILF